MNGAMPPLSQMPVLYFHRSVAFIDHWKFVQLIPVAKKLRQRLNSATRSVKFLFNF